MKTTSLSALVAAGLLAGGMSITSANAADLGGNCCADLEERIAELEATTVRKGNRKVSLTLSGWVAEQITWFDDGQESNVYISGIGRTLQTNMKLSGQAQISPGFSAGYLLHVEFGTPDSFGLGGGTDDPAEFISLGGGVVNDTERGVYTLQSYWWLKSDHYGKVSLGKVSQASDNTAILVDGSGSLVPANWVVFDGMGFALRNSATGLPVYTAGEVSSSWADISYCHFLDAAVGGDCNGITENVIRYDSPTYAGFSVSSSWGEDDMWDVAARYAGEFTGVKVAVAASYAENRDENLAVDLRGRVNLDLTGDGQVTAADTALANALATERKDVSYFQIGAYIQHVATGLFLYGAYGKEDVSNLHGATVLDLAPDNETWYLKAGIRTRCTTLGSSVFYAEYGEHQDMISPSLILTTGATGSEFQRYGLGVVQEIDAAAMSLWLAWRHHEGDIDTPTGNISVDEVDLVKFGALINF